MISKKTAVALSLMLVLLLTASSEAARKGRLIGKVVDPEGNSVEGVTVHATSDEVPNFNEIEVTDAKGVFKLDFKEIDRVYKYQFSKPGYVTMKTEQTWQKDGTDRFTFTIFPGEESSIEGVVPVTTSPEAAVAFNAGAAAMNEKDYATAEQYIEEALEFDPELRQGWVALCFIEHQQGDFQEAIDAAETAMELGSTDEVVLRTRYDSYRQLGDETKTEEARVDLERIGALAVEAKKIYNEGIALVKAGNTEGAYLKFQEALRADPNLEPALFAIATTGLESGHYQEAFDAAETILKDDPTHADAIRLRYNASLQIGDEPMIMRSLVSLATVEPDIAKKNLWHLAMAAYNANDMESAKKRFNTVLLVDSGNAQAHYLLGLIYLGEGDAAKADTMTHLEKFLELAPDDPDAPSAREILSYLGSS